MKKLHQEILNFVIGGVIGAVLLIGSVWVVSQERSLPGVMVGGVEVGGLEQSEIVAKLEKEIDEYVATLSYGEARLSVPKPVIKFDIEKSARQAREVGRGGALEWWRVMTGHREIDLEVEIDEVTWQAYAEELKGLVQIAAIPNELLISDGEVEYVNGEDGVVLDDERAKQDIVKVASRLITLPLPLRSEEDRQSLNKEEVGMLMKIAEALVGDNLEIVIAEEKARLEDEELISLISTSPEHLGEVSISKLENYVIGLSERYERDPQDAVLQFLDGRVSEFVAAKDGIKIIKQEAINGIRDGIVELLKEAVEEMVVEIQIERLAPEISTESVNNLGIVERIGKGESYYAHSIPNRVYNVGLAAKRVSGALVEPGEEFSFNNEVGEISGATGYRSAYVISGGRTILGDGGGVCQVSTTVFRAALSAGLPITERWAHAYRVGYYEQNSKAGFDATIYSPSKDLKFLNDTPGHILVQATVDEPNRHLIIELYGTRDGRISLISPARVWDVTPPPPDLYQDDPSLPVGVVQQVDWAAWGAKAAFDYRVEREGEMIFSKTFRSNFQPWQDVYLRGTGT